jgi:hypothetical protein
MGALTRGLMDLGQQHKGPLVVLNETRCFQLGWVSIYTSTFILLRAAFLCKLCFNLGNVDFNYAPNHCNFRHLLSIPFNSLCKCIPHINVDMVNWSFNLKIHSLTLWCCIMHATSIMPITCYIDPTWNLNIFNEIQVPLNSIEFKFQNWIKHNILLF